MHEEEPHYCVDEEESQGGGPRCCVDGAGGASGPVWQGTYREPNPVGGRSRRPWSPGGSAAITLGTNCRAVGHRLQAYPAGGRAVFVGRWAEGQVAYGMCWSDLIVNSS